MATATEHSPEITRAAERYLEQYGEPLVMNTYLKVTILVLAVVCIALSVLLFRSQMALANMHPMIVRINDVGRAEVIDYRNFQYRPQEAENKYYLSRWAELYFSRNRFTIERDQTNSLYFLNDDVQRAVINQEQKDNFIQSYVPLLPEVASDLRHYPAETSDDRLFPAAKGSAGQAAQAGREFRGFAETGEDLELSISRSAAHLCVLVHDERRRSLRTCEDPRPREYQDDRALCEAWTRPHCQDRQYSARTLEIAGSGSRETKEGT
jgi:hypothetical protein